MLEGRLLGLSLREGDFGVTVARRQQRGDVNARGRALERHAEPVEGFERVLEPRDGPRFVGEVMVVECAFTHPDLPTALRGLVASGVAVKAAELAGDGAVARANEDMLVPFKRADGGYRIENKFRFLLARV